MSLSVCKSYAFFIAFVFEIVYNIREAKVVPIIYVELNIVLLASFFYLKVGVFMNHNRDLAILNLFQAYLSDQESFEVDEEYLKYGIYIGKDASFETKEQAKYLWGIDSYLLNQTFHKSLETVLN